MGKYSLDTYESSYLRRGLREMCDTAEFLHYDFIGYAKDGNSYDKLSKTRKICVEDRIRNWKNLFRMEKEPYYEPLFVSLFFNQREGADDIIKLWEDASGESIFSEFARPVPWLPIKQSELNRHKPHIK